MGGPIATGGRRQGEALRLLQLRHVHQVWGGGGYAGGKPPDCIKARILAAALAVAPTVAALSLLLWDVLCLLQLGMVRTFLSEGGAGTWQAA